MTAFIVAMNTAWGFFMDKESGIFFEPLTYPITRRQLLIGKVCFNVLLSVLGAFLAISLGVFVTHIRIRWILLPRITAIIMATTAGWVFLLSIFAIRLRGWDAFNMFTSAAHLLDVPQYYVLSHRGITGWFRWSAQIIR